MKLLGVLLLCACAAAVPTVIQKIDLGIDIPSDAVTTVEGRNILINTLIRQFFTYVRYIISNGSIIFGFPPLDPLILDHYHLYIPAGLINLDLDLTNSVVTGIGGFVVHKSEFVPRDLSFELDISVPSIEVTCELYDLVGDILTGIPLYGKGQARFQVDNFRFRTTVILKQSEDGRSILIDKLIDTTYEVPYLKSELTGVIGGGEIDQIVNAVVEEVLVGYVNRFQGAVSTLVGVVLPIAANPILDQLDTWRYISIFV